MLGSLIPLFLGWLVAIIIDFSVMNKGTEVLNFKQTINFYFCKNRDYLIASVISFVLICYFYFSEQIQLPKDFLIDLLIFKITGIRTAEFIVGFFSSQLFLILRKLRQPAQIITK